MHVRESGFRRKQPTRRRSAWACSHEPLLVENVKFRVDKPGSAIAKTVNISPLFLYCARANRFGTRARGPPNHGCPPAPFAWPATNRPRRGPVAKRSEEHT